MCTCATDKAAEDAAAAMEVDSVETTTTATFDLEEEESGIVEEGEEGRERNFEIEPSLRKRALEEAGPEEQTEQTLDEVDGEFGFPLYVRPQSSC